MNEVHVLRTSPSSLRDDVDRALASAPLATLDPARPAWIKVNGNFNIDYPGSNTSRWFLGTLLESLKDRGFRAVTVVEGDLPEFRAEAMARATGLDALLQRYGVPFLSYERLPRDDFELPKALSEVQLLNTPVFHTHGHAVISCATKNLFGLLPVDRRKYHGKLSDKLLELVQRVPCATLVDGTVGLEGESTRRGDPVRTDLLIIGRDVLAIDVVAARVMGFEPRAVPLLARAEDLGRLPTDVRVKGDFEGREIPRHRFRLELGRIRKVAIWLHRRDIDVEPIYAATDSLRVLWHRLNYRRKKRRLQEGPWRDYADAPAEGVS